MRHYHIRDIACRVPPDCEFRAVVKFFDGSRGYGFLIPDGGGEDIYFNAVVLLEPDRAPMKGDPVLFNAGKRNGRYAATAVKVLA